MTHYQNQSQSAHALKLVPATATIAPVKKKRVSNNPLADVRRSVRSSATMLRYTARAMYILSVLIVFAFGACNGFARDAAMAIQQVMFHAADDVYGTLAAMGCILIGLILGCFTLFLGTILSAVASSLNDDVRKLSKEVK